MLLNKYNYKNLCEVIVSTFSQQGDQILEGILRCMKQHSITWMNDVDVLTQITTYLRVLSRSAICRNTMIHSAAFKDLTNLLLRYISHLPAVIHSELINSIAFIATHASDDSLKVAYFSDLSNAISRPFTALLTPTFMENFQTTVIREKVVSSMEMFCGLVRASDETNSPIIYQTCSPFFNSFLDIMRVYSNYPDVELYVIMFFRDFALHQSIDTLNNDDRQTLFKAVVSMFDIYTKHEVGRHHKVEGAESEGLLEDLSLLLQILSSLLNSEFEGYNNYQSNRVEGDVDITYIVICGMNSLLPLVTEDMLHHPSLCLDFITLVTLALQYIPDKVETLSPQLLESLVRALLYGVTKSTAIAEKSFLGIQHWADNFKPSTPNAEILMGSLAKDLIYTILSKPFDFSLVDAAALSVLAVWFVAPHAVDLMVQGDHISAVNLRDAKNQISLDPNDSGKIETFQMAFSVLLTTIKAESLV